jgi:hypothetical protein
MSRCKTTRAPPRAQGQSLGAGKKRQPRWRGCTIDRVRRATAPSPDHTHASCCWSFILASVPTPLRTADGDAPIASVAKMLGALTHVPGSHTESLHGPLHDPSTTSERVVTVCAALGAHRESSGSGRAGCAQPGRVRPRSRKDANDDPSAAEAHADGGGPHDGASTMHGS